jgi:phage tail tape-measure protein
MPNTADRWKNRRRMAWLSLFSGLVFPVLILATDSPQLGAVAGPFYIFVGAVVGAYVGFAVLDDKWSHEYDYDKQADARSNRGGGVNRVDNKRVASKRQNQPTESESRHGFDEGV